MVDDFYQDALATLRRHLDEAHASHTLDDGEIVIGPHRLGLSIAFDGFVTQGEHVLAPLDIQMHLDGDSGDRFRVGTLGVGPDPAGAAKDAIAQWHLLAASPVLAALGAPVTLRRAGEQPQSLAGWDLFAGHLAVRGRVPSGLRGEGPFLRALLGALSRAAGRWDPPARFTLHSVYVMATCGPEPGEVQAAHDGLLDEELTAAVRGLPWPASSETYLFKQLFVLRGGGAD